MEDDDAVKAHTTKEHLLGEIQTSQTWKIGLQQHPLDISISISLDKTNITDSASCFKSLVFALAGSTLQALF